MKPVLIFGAGQVAHVMAEMLRDDGHYVTACVIDEQYGSSVKDFNGLRAVVTTTQAVAAYPPENHQFVVGMSFRGLNAIRAAKFDQMKAMGYEPLTFVHRDARVSHTAKIGAGSFVMDGNMIQTGAEIGDNCLLWSGNHVGHHSRIANHVFVASHAVISGSVEIGDYSFVGVNATIRDNVKVGKRCVIGAAALITKDCADDGVYSPGGTERSAVPSYRLRGI